MSQQTAPGQSMPTPPEVPGHRLGSVIGSGGSSVVWSGTDAAGRPVAVKVPHARADCAAREQAGLERHVLMAVEHEHLVRLRDVVPMTDGRVALVFDLVEGALLAGLVGRRGHLRAGEVVTVLTPLCHAVTALHAAGGTHGDISAGNVMVTRAGLPLLLDLGATRVIATRPGASFGTPGFVAPEVRRGVAPDARSDVFSLGALAWFCATGNGAPDTEQRLDLETVTSHVGTELAPVVAACIDPDPGRRPDCATLARLFYDASRAEPVEVVVGGDDAAALTHRLRLQAAGELPVPETAPGWRARWRRRSRGPRMLPAEAGLQPRPTPSTESPEARTTGSAPRRFVARQKSLMALGAALVVAVGAVVVSSAAADGPVVGGLDGRGGANPVSTTTVATPKTAGVATPKTATSPGATGVRGSVPVADVRADRQAPNTRAAALITALSQTRAAALTGQNRAQLAEVHRTRSASWSADSKLIDALESQHLRWESLRPSVVSARLVQKSESRAVVRAQVGWATYEAVSSDGTRQLRSADPGATLDFALVWLPQGWRLESLSAPAVGTSPPGAPATRPLSPTAPAAS